MPGMRTSGRPVPTVVVRRLSPGATSMSRTTARSSATVVSGGDAAARTSASSSMRVLRMRSARPTRAECRADRARPRPRRARGRCAPAGTGPRRPARLAETGAPVRRRYSRYESPRSRNTRRSERSSRNCSGLRVTLAASGSETGRRRPDFGRVALARRSSATAASFTRASTRSVRLRASSLDSEVPGREVWLGMGTCRVTAGNASVPERGEGI